MIAQLKKRQVLAADLPALIRAARKVVGGRGRRLQGAVRSEIRRALGAHGARLAAAIRHKSRDIPDGVESTVVSTAFSKPYQGPPGGRGRFERVEQVGLLQAEEVTTPTAGRFMAFPLPPAGRGPRDRAPRVSDFPVGFFRAIFRGNRGVLVPKDHPSVVYFILVPKTRRSKFLSSSKSWEPFATEGLSTRIFDEWSRHRATIALQRIA